MKDTLKNRPEQDILALGRLAIRITQLKYLAIERTKHETSAGKLNRHNHYQRVFNALNGTTLHHGDNLVLNFSTNA